MISRLCKLPNRQSFFLFGPRGSGKSTLLKAHFSELDVTWVDLLNKKTEWVLAQNPDFLADMWRAKKSEWVIIDEIQKVPALLDVVHQLIETEKIKFGLTGSSARKLKREGANLLAGRAVQRELQAFSALELAAQFDFKKCLSVGLLPVIWNENYSLSEAADFLYSYVDTYLKEEVAAEQLVRNLDPFRRFLVSAAQSNGKIINYAAIDRDAGVNAKQSERHFEILVDTLIGNFLPPFETSIRKRQTKKSKFYFFDVGVVRALKNIAAHEQAYSTYEFGEIFETFLINEFFKLSSALLKRWQFSYFQTTENNEIDLLIEKPRGAPVLIEIKAFNKVVPEKISSIIRLKKDIRHSQAYVVSNDPQEFEINGVRCLHWQQALIEIFEL